MSNALYAIAENTAIPVAAFTKGDAGKTMAGHWQERSGRETKETRTAEEIIAHIRETIAAL